MALNEVTICSGCDDIDYSCTLTKWRECPACDGHFVVGEDECCKGCRRCPCGAWDRFDSSGEDYCEDCEQCKKCCTCGVRED